MTTDHPDAITRGVHHAGLTVPDIEAARRFFTEELGFVQVGEKPDYPAVFVSDGSVMLTLWQVKDPREARPFDRTRNVGLHHLALAVESHAALDSLGERLAVAEGVAVEFPPEPIGTAGWRHMMCAIPGGVRLELICTSARGALP